MDKYTVKITPRAISELGNIYEYIANEKLYDTISRAKHLEVLPLILFWVCFEMEVPRILNEHIQPEVEKRYSSVFRHFLPTFPTNFSEYLPQSVSALSSCSFHTP